MIKALTKRAETGRSHMGGAGGSSQHESFIPYRCVCTSPSNVVLKSVVLVITGAKPPTKIWTWINSMAASAIAQILPACALVPFYHSLVVHPLLSCSRLSFEGTQENTPSGHKPYDEDCTKTMFCRVRLLYTRGIYPGITRARQVL